MVPKVALLRCQSVSAAHGASVNQNHYAIASDGWPATRALNRRFFKGMTFSFCSLMISGMTGPDLGLPVAWVVKCKKCACTINCRAIDPQIEHAQPDRADPPPQDTVIVTCSCCWAAYRYSPAEVFKAPPGPSSNCHRRTPPDPNSNNNNNNKDAEKRPNGRIGDRAGEYESTHNIILVEVAADQFCSVVVAIVVQAR